MITLTTPDINHLIHNYLMRNNYHHSAYIFSTEAKLTKNNYNLDTNDNLTKNSTTNKNIYSYSLEDILLGGCKSIYIDIHYKKLLKLKYSNNIEDIKNIKNKDKNFNNMNFYRKSLNKICFNDFNIFQYHVCDNNIKYLNFIIKDKQISFLPQNNKTNNNTKNTKITKSNKKIIFKKMSIIKNFYLPNNSNNSNTEIENTEIKNTENINNKINRNYNQFLLMADEDGNFLIFQVINNNTIINNSNNNIELDTFKLKLITYYYNNDKICYNKLINKMNLLIMVSFSGIIKIFNLEYINYIINLNINKLNNNSNINELEELITKEFKFNKNYNNFNYNAYEINKAIQNINNFNTLELNNLLLFNDNFINVIPYSEGPIFSSTYNTILNSNTSTLNNSNTLNNDSNSILNNDNNYLLNIYMGCYSGRCIELKIKQNNIENLNNTLCNTLNNNINNIINNSLKVKVNYLGRFNLPIFSLNLLNTSIINNNNTIDNNNFNSNILNNNNLLALGLQDGKLSIINLDSYKVDVYKYHNKDVIKILYIKNNININSNIENNKINNNIENNNKINNNIENNNKINDNIENNGYMVTLGSDGVVLIWKYINNLKLDNSNNLEDYKFTSVNNLIINQSNNTNKSNLNNYSSSLNFIVDVDYINIFNNNYLLLGTVDGVVRIVNLQNNELMYECYLNYKIKNIKLSKLSNTIHVIIVGYNKFSILKIDLSKSKAIDENNNKIDKNLFNDMVSVVTVNKSIIDIDIIDNLNLEELYLYYISKSNISNYMDINNLDNNNNEDCDEVGVIKL